MADSINRFMLDGVRFKPFDNNVRQSCIDMGPHQIHSDHRKTDGIRINL